MFKVIVVDDDKIIRKSIIQSANWEEEGFSFAGEAYNGCDALKKIEELHPDLVITDICMPLMDGIELIHHVKDKFPHIKFIVLSNYDDFKYVKTALKNGALDYILKYDISKESFCKLLQQAKDAIFQEIKYKETDQRIKDLESKNNLEKVNNFWNSLVGGKLSIKSMDFCAGNLGIQLLPLHGMFILFRCSEGNSAYKSIMERICDLLKDENSEADVHLFHLNDREDGIFVNFRRCLSSSDILMKVLGKVHWLPELKAVQDVNYIFSVSDVFHTLDGMMAYAAKSMEMLKTMYYNSTNKVVTPRTYIPFTKVIDMEKYEKEVDDILQNLIAKKLPDSINSFNKLMDHIEEDYIDPNLVTKIYHYLLHELNRICEVRNIESKSFYQSGSIPLTILDEAGDYNTVKKITKNLLEEIDKDLYAVDFISDNDEVKKAIDYMVKNHPKPIGLKDVADFVGLSKNHFCRLFKQHTNENFLDYLNRIRIERAKQMLANTESSINDIALSVGFSEYRYFKQVFFKYTGMFPSELRKSRTL